MTKKHGPSKNTGCSVVHLGEMNKRYAKVVNYPATEGIFSTLHLRKSLQLLKSYTITSSRCLHCWSALDKGFAQTHGNRLLLPLHYPHMLLFISPNFSDPFPLILYSSSALFMTYVYHSHGDRYTKASQEDMERTEILILLHGFFPFSLSSYSVRL